MANRVSWLKGLLLGFLMVALVVPLTAEESPVTGEYFGLPGCHECQEFLDTTWEDLRRQAASSGRSLSLVEHDILDEKSFALMKSLLEERQVPFTGVPVLVWGTLVLQGDDLTPGRLPALLGVTPEVPAPVPPTVSAPASLSWAVVTLAGLVDGINPCVLTLLVFLLSVWKFDRSASLSLGLAYAAGVFTCYTLIGVGLLQAAALAQTVPWAGTLLTVFTLTVLAVLTGLSLWDAWKAHRGQLSSLTLKLPRVADQAVRALIRRGRGWVGLPAAFFLGAAISLLEFVCTGQVYLPTLVYLNKTGEDGALALLLWYNLAFLVPLLVVFALVHWGTAHRVLVQWAQAHVALSKVLLAVVYGLLGLALLFAR